MTPLVTIADFAAYAEITANVDDTKRLVPYILQAQKYDLRTVLGDALYFEFVGNPAQTAPPYDKLLGGDTYVVGTADIAFEGVKPALVYRAYARFLQHNNVASTAYGMVVKKNDYSDPISAAQLAQLVNYARAMAEAEEQTIVAYLNAKATTFPLWRYGNVAQATTGAVRIRAVDPYDDNRRCACGRFPTCKNYSQCLP